MSVVQVEGDDRWWVTGVSCSRPATAWPGWCPFGETSFDEIVTELRPVGCPAHGTDFGVVAVDIPPEADADTVLAALAAGRDAGRWDFDVGVKPT